MGQLKLEVLIDVMRTPYLQHCEARISDANIGTVLQAVDMLPILAEVDDFRFSGEELHSSFTRYYSTR